MTIDSNYLNANFGVENQRQPNYIGSIDPNTGAPLTENIVNADLGISGSLYDLIAAQFLQNGVSLEVARTYASFILESTKISGQDYTDFLEVKESGNIELSLIGYAYINRLRDDTSKIGIKTDADFNNLVKQSIRI